jgi:carboxyl-terminal processing protease
VTIVARESPDSVGRKTFVVRRDGPNGELLPTPKTEEDDGGGGDDD